MKPFTIAVPESELEDLEQRLSRVRWPDQIGDPWEYGTDVGYLKELIGYWRAQFDWRAAEAQLNQFDHFTTDVAGQALHFIHQRSTHDHALPLLITHGWPGSISEFVKIIGPLTQPEAFGGNPADAFHVICPSIPGYGFSEAPMQRGFHPKACAERFVQLMAELGYERYFAQGGDAGAAVATWMGWLAPSELLGIHLNLVFVRPPKEDPFRDVTEEERGRVTARRKYMTSEMDYARIQGSKPQSLGYGLNDSPVGLAAWITEKFHRWTLHTGNLEDAVSKAELLTNISIYWFTQSITSSMRMYYESRRYETRPFPDRVDVPTAVANFPGELSFAPRAWVERQFNLVHWSFPERGGHFAALEAPDLLVGDIRDSLRSLRP